ncbi:hypothetical protein BT67DRAFT_477604 [Trichocladium antarcticum]|uniref:Ecp2 effector protein-like domain-containing protein n=1 Tax=Trichocladium antarcticum TaxID=1450529 RepID=A0AAN6UJ87_9PEZI|nr:hypothetical protein BT67DRAFT_477604 [Trichocladium antarcticum]
MPSPIHALVLALAALATTTLATPTPADYHHTATHSKRVTYHPSDRHDYCGEVAVARYTYGPAAPLITDCQAIPRAHPGPGYWSITPADTLAAGGDRWVRLATSGTCAFEVRAERRTGQGDKDLFEWNFGTNDLNFYSGRVGWGKEGKGDGREAVASTVGCITTRVGEGRWVDVGWRTTLA